MNDKTKFGSGRLVRSLSNSLHGRRRSDKERDPNNSSIISFPKGKRGKLKQKYRITDSKTGQPDGISFEVVDKSGFYLRAKGTTLVPDREGSDSYFSK